MEIFFCLDSCNNKQGRSRSSGYCRNRTFHDDKNLCSYKVDDGLYFPILCVYAQFFPVLKNDSILLILSISARKLFPKNRPTLQANYR